MALEACTRIELISRPAVSEPVCPRAERTLAVRSYCS